MKVYSVGVNVDDYQWILPDDCKAWLHYTRDLDCQKWGNTWTPMEFHVDDPKMRRGSFSHIGPSVFAFEPEVLDVMLGLFERSGEILDIRYEGRGMKILNVTECVNCLDQKESEWATAPDGRKLWVRKHAFLKDRFSDTPLFKVPEAFRSEILTISGLKHPEEEFMGRYEAAGLTGLEFKELWSDGTDLGASED